VHVVHVEETPFNEEARYETHGEAVAARLTDVLLCVATVSHPAPSSSLPPLLEEAL
jgi:hypothetical protein